MSHLAEDELLDVLEGRSTPAARQHAEACPRCRGRVNEARGGLDEARRAEVPEPSPLYWESLQRQVGRRIDEERRRRGTAGRLWPVAAGLAAVLAMVLVRPWEDRPEAPAPSPLPAWSALPSEEDAGLLVLQALAPAAEDLRIVAGCQGVAECVSDLDEDESRALAEALRVELEGGKL